MLVLYARHLGYLHARPKVAHSKTQSKSRLQQMQEQGMEVTMPPVPRWARHLLDDFLEPGPASHATGAPVPLPFSEILAWQQAAGIELTPWEARLVRRLSREYVTQYASSDSPDAPPPWGAETDSYQRAAVARRVRLIFGARAASGRKPQ